MGKPMMGWNARVRLSYFRLQRSAPLDHASLLETCHRLRLPGAATALLSHVLLLDELSAGHSRGWARVIRTPWAHER